ncbi:cytochrome P450 9e2-like [Microplitis mediator]|uniref:cytochrome P450 9e2-like n=1 Tax=Microplitis mediator TaxID=375433 RepID=UPI00255605E5|nr:cytochrome P450 9e2-like [Microplitis mediator]
MEVFLAIVGLITIYYLFFRKNFFEKHGIPHKKPFPFFGNMGKIIFRKATGVDLINDTYNCNSEAKFVGFFNFTSPVIMIRDLELIKSITVKNFDHFVDHKSLSDPEMEPLLGNNLLSLSGDRWRQIRTLLSPAFTSSKMKGMFKLMSECASNFSDYLVGQAQNNSIEFNSKDIFTRYTNDTIATCAFGVSVDSMNNPDNDFYVFGKKGTSFVGIKALKFFISSSFPKLAKLFRVKVIEREVEKFFYDLVRDTIATRDAKGIYRPDMIQLMMEARGNNPGSKTPELSIESMTSQAFVFFFGGFDSTSTLMCFAAHEIASHPEIQEKLQKEIDQVLEKCDGDPTYEAINSMIYLDAVVNEALRKYPIQVAIDRVCTKNFELPPTLPGSKPVSVKSGDNIWVPVWAIHRDPQYFPDPEKFIPERFIGDAKDDLNTSAYLPFGVGPRMCIGNRFALLEIKVLFFYLLAKCTIKISDKMILPIQFSKSNIFLMAEGGFWLEIQSRENMFEVSWSTVLAILAGLFVAYYFFSRENYFAKYGIPHSKPLILFGNMAPVVFRRKTFVDNVTNAYKTHSEAKYVGFFEFTTRVTMLRDLDLIKTVTVKYFDHFMDHRSFADPKVDPLFSNNLFSLRGDQWREIRTLLTPAFTSSKMKAMFKLMSQCADTFGDCLVKQSEKKQPFNSKDIFTRYTNDTIATCAFGVSVDSMNNPDNDFYVLGRNATTFDGLKTLKFFIVRSFPTIARLLSIKLFDTKTEKFFYDLVRDTIATRDAKGINRPDMIQLMMETRGSKPGSKTPELSIESMTSQAFIFFFGGFDSTATLMCFAAHEIASHPEIQEKLQKEVDQVLEKCDGDPTYEAINSMIYLDAVVNETLRLYPIAGFMDRLCTKSFELPPTLPGSKPLLVKPGDNLWVPVWSIHRDPQYFPDPDNFTPERFIGEAKDSLNTSAYFPFGVGPRMCIGNRFALLEIKVLFFHLLAKCNIKPAKKMILPMRLSKKSFALMAEGGFWLDITPRQ